MQTIEFETELQGKNSLQTPAELAAQLPPTGRAKVILFWPEVGDEKEWRPLSYEQFMREEPPEDSVYNKYL